jgi:hypothetical protein
MSPGYDFRRACVARRSLVWSNVGRRGSLPIIREIVADYTSFWSVNAAPFDELPCGAGLRGGSRPRGSLEQHRKQLAIMAHIIPRQTAEFFYTSRLRAGNHPNIVAAHFLSSTTLPTALRTGCDQSAVGLFFGLVDDQHVNRRLTRPSGVLLKLVVICRMYPTINSAPVPRVCQFSQTYRKLQSKCR